MSTELHHSLAFRSGIATLPVIIACGCITAFSLAMWTYEHGQETSLQRDRTQNAAALDHAKQQIAELTNRLNTFDQQRLAAAQPPDLSMSVHTAPVQPAPVSHPAIHRVAAVSHRAPVHTVAAADPRLDRLQGQLAETQKQLATTRDELNKDKEELDGRISSTRDDLNGSIAKTHDEVVALQKRGERNIYEFKLTKSKQLQRVGPVSLSLRSTSTRHNTYDLAMLVDDNSLSKKHVNLYEPVWITLSDRPQPVELVVNHVGKNDIAGYVSAPRYRNSELASNADQSPKPPQPQLESRDRNPAPKNQ